MAGKLGIYIHIPFCHSKCDYCDFYSLAGREGLMDPYLKALVCHIRETAPLAKGYQVDTIYFGGGTPSYFGEKRLRVILGELYKRFDVTRDVEVTVECNPESADLKSLVRLRRAGVNRISLGVQSACNRELACIHRPHSFEEAQRAVAAVREAKIHNLSLDLIYGLPQQTLEAWQNTVEQVLALEPEHLSCYGLKVEFNTPLYKRVQRGERLPDDDLQADMYLWMVDRLEKAGYHQYEISNFARPGYQSRHNLKYWMGRPYVGFGPGAHSDFGNRRYSFVRSLESYIEGINGEKDIVDENDLISRQERSGEYLMLRLRTTRGIEEWEYRREFSMSFEPIEQKMEEFERYGWATRKDRRWFFTPKGFLVSNQLIGDVLSAQEQDTLQAAFPKLRQDREESGD